MKILFLTDNFPPEVNAPATRTFEHCKEWVKKGVEVTVITCNPNFPQGRIYDGYKNKFIQREEVEGIKVIRVWSYISANKGFLKRSIDFVSYAFMAFCFGLFIKTDLIVATSPQFFTAIAGRWLSFFKHTPWVMEVRDLWPESIKAVGAMSGDSFGYRMLEKMEMSMYRSARQIVVVTDTFKKIIVEKGIDAKKIFVIKNGVRLDKFKPIEKDKTLLKELNLHGKFIIGYIGTHGMAHALDFVLQSAQKIKNKSIHFILLGDGAEKKKLLLLKDELMLTNITMLPFVAKSEITRYISILDVALVNLKKSDTFKTVIPSKIFENAAMKKPILLGVEGESKGIIEKYNAGICFEPENELEFIESIDSLFENTLLYSSYKKGCQNLAMDFNRDNLAEQMLHILKYEEVKSNSDSIDDTFSSIKLKIKSK